MSTLSTLLAAALFVPLAHQKPPQEPAPPPLNLDDGLALGGYDPVSYFPSGGGKPVKGERAHETRVGKATYRFASAEHRALFLEDPGRFEPAYGGWCAYAMARGERVEVDPRSFLIQDGELLVFYDGVFSDTRKSWSKGDRAAQKLDADREWRELGGRTERDLTHWSLAGGVALGGYDPIAYFPSGGASPRLGEERRSARYRGVTYRFASDANREAFLRDPGAYEARYGGWCAQAMSEGRKVAPHPQAYLVAEGRLYLFADAARRDAFATDRAARAAKADEHWRGL